MVQTEVTGIKTLSLALRLPLSRNKRQWAPRVLWVARNMSSKPPPEPRPSASVLLISHRNDVLLLHRVQTSSAFPSAHVFPGGNLSAKQDGALPEPSHPDRHEDGSVYRIGAIRECFEESGILLARPKGSSERLLDLSDEVRESGRKKVHANTVNFQEWVESQGGELDLDGLVPFTRWITPIGPPKRFTTQMYLYFLPLTTDDAVPGVAKAKEAMIQNPTHDGGLEHTAARFLPAQKWLEMARSGEVIMFPPQYFLIHLLASFFSTEVGAGEATNSGDIDTTSNNASLQAQRVRLTDFVRSGYPPWTEKCISPRGLLTLKDGRQVLSLESPGPELKGSSRRGESDLVVLVSFKKEGPRDVEVVPRAAVWDAAKQEKRAGQKGLKL